MKKIALIGASGFVGSALLHEALERGHSVTAIVRHPEKITWESPNLHVKQGDILSEESVPELIAGADVVISAYNPGWNNPNIAVDTAKGYKSIINGVKSAGISRLLIVGGAGSLLVSPGKRVMDTAAIPESFKPGIKSLADVLYTLQEEEKELDWAFFSPAGSIAPGERTGKFRLGKDDLVADRDGKSNISVEDYAVAMLDEVEIPQHHRERFTIGY
ncbi:MAG: NAD(P)-dependent oxidoreductase [Bacteroidota bacterium]|nr:NAD(P)-dependent oxidoreductase [Bacteroidota bacterium]